MIVGGGPYLETLRKLAHDTMGWPTVTFTGGVAADELPARHALADVFAMPCRTRSLLGWTSRAWNRVPPKPPPPACR